MTDSLAHATRPRVHLGINTCFAVKRWPEPAAWLAIIADDLGLDTCQFSLDLVDPLLDLTATTEYASAAREQARARGVTIHSTFTGLAAYSWSQLLHPDAALRAGAMRWYQRAFGITTALGAHGTGGHFGAFSARDYESPIRRDMLMRELHQNITALAQSAADADLAFLLVENMATIREYGSRISEADALLGEHARDPVPLALCLDVGHPGAMHLPAGTDKETGADSASTDYRAWLAHPWIRTPVVHLQQSDRTGDHHWPFTAEYNAQGVVRAEEVLHAIARWPAGQDVYLILEVIPPFEAPDHSVLADLRASAAYWRRALADAGW